MPIFAHSLPTASSDHWETLAEHLAIVGGRAASFASPFGWGEAARVLGMLHDIGKVSPAFQSYISKPPEEGVSRKGPDHSTAGARVVREIHPGPFGLLLANVVAGHHSGLDDAEGLERRLSSDHRIEPYADWQTHTGPVPPPRAILPNESWTPDVARPGFCRAFLARMLFSCLVDADFLGTESFHLRAEGRPDTRGGEAGIPELRDRLRAHMTRIDGMRDDAVSRARSRVLAAAREKAAMAPGLFTLTVPTGGGKTFASLSFALEHAARHGLRRVIHVAPFSAIIEQTAAVFREALDTEEDVLEHHAAAAWSETEDDEEGPGGERKLRQAAENWDVPVVVTTAVQFFESLFARKPSRCRKLHNLARSVIVLDEAQALPVGLLRPCLAAVAELARAYGATVVLCTATQPAVRVADEMEGGLDIPAEREIAPDPPALYAALRRVRVEVRPDPMTDAEVAARFAEAPQMLCIVNSRAHARDLFAAIRGQGGAVHLSTLMVPRHRRQVLEEVRRRAAAGEPARVVSTSLIEAGVDLDLPEVWRAVAGVDSIAQAAGRCNRNGCLPMGRTVVFEPAEAPVPCFAQEFFQATREVLRRHDDLLGLDAVRDYFRELYWQKGPEALDAIRLDGERRGVLPALEAHGGDCRFPFRALAEAFRLIDEAMEPVVVPWDGEAEAALRMVAAVDRPTGRMLRRLQPYTVGVPAKARRDWLARGALRPVHPALGDALLTFGNREHYDPETGLDLARPEYRQAESNLF